MNDPINTNDSNPPKSEAAASEPSAHHPSPLDHLKTEDLKARITEVLRTIYDPEIPVNIFDLGLIYDIQTDPAGAVIINMTLTTPMCPVAVSLPPDVENRVRAMHGVTEVKVNVVWDPPWTPDKMTEDARLQLGLM